MGKFFVGQVVSVVDGFEKGRVGKVVDVAAYAGNPTVCLVEFGKRETWLFADSLKILGVA